MKRFLTKEDACFVLKEIQNGKTLTHNDCVALSSIRVCIAGELMGLNLWGENIEEAKPAFIDCEKPNAKNNSEFLKENYEVYKYCVAEVYEKFGKEKYNG